MYTIIMRVAAVHVHVVTSYNDCKVTGKLNLTSLITLTHIVSPSMNLCVRSILARPSRDRAE